MLRGYVECARDLGKAKDLLQRMEKEKILASRPNVRTANTFLRGCLILGSVNDAEGLLERMTTKWAEQEEWYTTHGGKPDASTYELVVSLLCQALRSASICRGILFSVFLSKSSCARAKALGWERLKLPAFDSEFIGRVTSKHPSRLHKSGTKSQKSPAEVHRSPTHSSEGYQRIGCQSRVSSDVCLHRTSRCHLWQRRGGDPQREACSQDPGWRGGLFWGQAFQLLDSFEQRFFSRKLRVYNPTAKRNTAHLSFDYDLSLGQSSWISASKVWLEVVANVGLRNGTATRRMIPLQQIGKLPGRAV